MAGNDRHPLAYRRLQAGHGRLTSHVRQLCPLRRLRALLPPSLSKASAGASLPRVSVALSSLTQLNKGKTSTVALHNYLFVEGIQMNLFSVYRLGKNGYTANIRPKRTDSEAEGGRRYPPLPKAVYTQSTQNVTVPVCALARLNSALSATLTVWHCRFSHLSTSAIQRMSKQALVQGLAIAPSGSVTVCNACQTGKSRRLPFSPLSKHATRQLELIHSDLVEISHASLGGPYYAMTLVDNFSRNSWVYLLGKKSEALDRFKEWVASVVLEQDSCS